MQIEKPATYSYLSNHLPSPLSNPLLSLQWFSVMCLTAAGLWPVLQTSGLVSNCVQIHVYSPDWLYYRQIFLQNWFGSCLQSEQAPHSPNQCLHKANSHLHCCLVLHLRKETAKNSCNMILQLTLILYETESTTSYQYRRTGFNCHLIIAFVSF